MEALDSQDDCKHSNKDKQMSIGRKKFNMDPKKGKYNFVKYLVVSWYDTDGPVVGAKMVCAALFFISH